MTADDRKTLEELREVLEAFRTGDNPIEADFIAALTRVLEEPGDETLILWAMVRRELIKETPFIEWSVCRETPITSGRMWVRTGPFGWSLNRGAYDLNLGDGPLPVLTPAARAVLLEAYRKEKVDAL